MSDTAQCSALINGQCKNGFFTTPACRHGQLKAAPMCMDEDWCGRIFHKTDGIPLKLYAEIMAAEEQA